jgi:cell division septation protein DedD
MASSGRNSGGDLVLESKHLAGLFLLLVVIFGVVFTLGYLLGRSQYDPKLRTASANSAEAGSAAASSSKAKGNPAAGENLPADKNSDWDFYHSGEPKTGVDHLQPPASPPVFAKSVNASKSAAAPKSMAAEKSSAAPATAEKSLKQSKSSAPLNAPLIPKGAVMLQVAAVQSQGDALALAQALQEKKFPAFVIPPSADKYFRVQVGPYSDGPAATSARHDLEAKGFKSIVKR